MTVLIPPLCPALCELVHCSLPGSSIHGLELEDRSSFRSVAVIKGRGQVGRGLDVGRNGEKPSKLKRRFEGRITKTWNRA